MKTGLEIAHDSLKKIENCCAGKGLRDDEWCDSCSKILLRMQKLMAHLCDEESKTLKREAEEIRKMKP